MFVQRSEASEAKAKSVANVFIHGVHMLRLYGAAGVDKQPVPSHQYEPPRVCRIMLTEI